MKKVLFVVLIMMLLLVVAMPTFAAGQTKSDVCHLDDAGNYMLINIADPALDSHKAHGDSQPGDDVPGMEGYKFSDACVPVPVPPETCTITAFSPLFNGFTSVTTQVSLDIVNGVLDPDTPPGTEGWDWQGTLLAYYFGGGTTAGAILGEDGQWNSYIASTNCPEPTAPAP